MRLDLLYLVLALMWRLLAHARSASSRWMCLLIAAFFPAQVYLAAIFPISVCIAAILACLYRHRLSRARHRISSPASAT